MDSVNEWWKGCARLMLPLIPIVVLAAPAYATVPSGAVGAQTCGGTSTSSCTNTDLPGLADSAEPGAVLIFPKFDTGTVTLDNAYVAPRTQIEIGAVCAAAAGNASKATYNSPACASKIYTVHIHWVCPPAAGTIAGNPPSGECFENDFDVAVSTYGKIVFNPGSAPGTPFDAKNASVTGYNPAKGGPSEGGTTAVPSAPCVRGYALAWVVSSDGSDTPIAWNVLIGDAVMRNVATDLQSYSALAIQSVDNDGDPTSDAVTAGGPVPLLFDGASGNYQMVTGQIWGDVRFNQDATAPFADTQLILGTLDVVSNSFNETTTVNLKFYGANQNELSTATNFICWEQVNLTNIDPNLTNTGMFSPNGMVVSGQAYRVIDGTYVTLFGLIQTVEGASGVPTTAANEVRSYTSRPSNNSVPVETTFTP